jgi:tetratricopeptide (TPR) repeat protein
MRRSPSVFFPCLAVAAVVVFGITSTSSRTASAQEAQSLLREAEAARAQGRLQDAATLYARAQSEAGPNDPVAARGACSVAIEREQQLEPGISSRELCRKAFDLGSTAEDLANKALSLIAPNEHPTTDELATVALLSEGATRKSPNEPWGFLVRCEMARRAGSAAELAACREDLLRVAPTHPATLRELARAPVRTSPIVWIFRWLVLLMFTGTIAHAFARRRVRRVGGRAATGATGAAVVCCLLSLLTARPAAAVAPMQDLSNIPINDADPEKSIPTLEQQQKDPLEFGYLLQDFLERALAAWKKGDHARAARYYKALTIAAPHAAYGPGKWCQELEALGDFEQAIIACRTAITRGGSTAEDYERFVNVVLKSDKPLPPLEHKELDNVLNHLDQEKADLGTMPALLRCQVGAHYHDVAELETCTARLAKLAPKDQKTILYQWSLAIEKHDSSTANELIRRARDAGMPAAGLVRMEKATSELTRQRMGRLVLVGISLVMLVLASRTWLRRAASRRVAPAGSPSTSA